MSVVNVTVVDTQSDDEVTSLALPEGTTISQLLNIKNVNLDKMSVHVKLDGERITWDGSDELEDGMRITITPEQLKGA